MIETFNKESYVEFLNQMFLNLGYRTPKRQLDERIIGLLKILEDCKCFDHSV